MSTILIVLVVLFLLGGGAGDIRGGAANMPADQTALVPFDPIAGCRQEDRLRTGYGNLLVIVQEGRFMKRKAGSRMIEDSLPRKKGDGSAATD